MKVKSNVKAGPYRARADKGGLEEWGEAPPRGRRQIRRGDVEARLSIPAVPPRLRGVLYFTSGEN